MFYLLLRVKTATAIDPPKRIEVGAAMEPPRAPPIRYILTPLWFTVGDLDRFREMTVVNGEYTIAIAPLEGKNYDEAFNSLRACLTWFEPLLRGAHPEPWLAERMPMTFSEPRYKP